MCELDTTTRFLGVSPVVVACPQGVIKSFRKWNCENKNGNTRVKKEYSKKRIKFKGLIIIIVYCSIVNMVAIQIASTCLSPSS